VYAPYTPEGKQAFLDWFQQIDMPTNVDWLVVGDFNLIRRAKERNKPGGNVPYMLRFNAAISALGLEELKLNGNRFTWTNKQSSPLLERLNWFFASVAWLTNYPGSSISTFSWDTFDHSPCLISVNTDIPKSKIFQFEKYWFLHRDFMQVMTNAWNAPVLLLDKAKKVGAKFKNMRRILKF
jgi:hypothetical protein